MGRIHSAINDLHEIEEKARERDLEIAREQEIDLARLKEIERKAEEQGYIIIRKSSKNQTPFTQIINDNLKSLVEAEYLTQNEIGFLTSIMPFMEYQTNAIINKETNEFMTIAELSQYLKMARQTVSRTVNKLLEKGILFEFVNIQEIKKYSRTISARTLFVNPELFYSGDRNKIDGTLAKLVFENDILEKKGYKLKWKVFKKPHHTFGKLYSRRSYLNFINK